MFGSLFRSRPPLVRIEEFSRQIAAGDLSPVARLFFDFAFPGFLGPVRDKPEAGDLSFDPGDETAQAYAREMEQKLTYARTRRRYAGDILSFVGARQSDLPRQRYHAVCAADGRDYGLLRAELDAYTDYARSGFFMLLDMQIPEEAAMFSLDPHPAIVGLMGPGRKAWTRFRRMVMEELPEVDAAPVAQLQDDQPLSVRMATSTHLMEVDEVLDLRRLEARTWFFETYRRGVKDFPGYGEDVAEMVEPASEDQEEFIRMLPALHGVLPGGPMITQIIGADLRRRGVNGLVYPSARKDALSIQQDGELVDWRGFNFVDYRGAPKALTPQEADVRFISLVDSSDAGKMRRYKGKQVYATPDRLWAPPGLADDIQAMSEAEAGAAGFQILGPEARRERLMQQASSADREDPENNFDNRGQPD